MAKEPYKPLYRASFSSGGVLQNEIFPIYINQMMAGISMMENKEKNGVSLVLSMLSALLPSLKKLFRNYDDLYKKLKECRELNREWIKNYKNFFPTALAENLHELYTEWWSAYTECGAGIEIQKLDPRRDAKVYNYLTGKRPSKTPAFNIQNL